MLVTILVVMLILFWVISIGLFTFVVSNTNNIIRTQVKFPTYALISMFAIGLPCITGLIGYLIGVII